ncbi:16503_t:CDS:2 [Acaulospora morrowiae]|uniref:16503_t:CDS:1 n=1 Tax=Acaulospora morrowiae TaxID=94023 RepID=A0A9N9I4U8_9GLOM|nr:16503_t:CDS:2 [Acaulospora morrowiae]
MPRPVRQEDLDFVSCENDRYESEIVKWRKHQMLEALEQDAVEVQRILYAARSSALKKFEEAEQRRTEEFQKWKQLYEKIEADYEKERLQRKLDFEAQQAQWKKLMQVFILVRSLSDHNNVIHDSLCEYVGL